MKLLGKKLERYSKGTIWLRALVASMFVCMITYLGVLVFNWGMEAISVFRSGSFYAALQAWPYFVIAFVVLFAAVYLMEKFPNKSNDS